MSIRSGRPQPVKLNLLDRVVNYFAPGRAMQRVRARAAFGALTESGYITFGSNRTSMRGAVASANSADADINDKLEMLRASSRDMFMNAPIATGALKRCKTNIVGYGLKLQSRIDRDILKISDDEAEAWEHKTEREFELWASDPRCDATATQNFYDLQGLALLSTMMSGDCFVMMPQIPRPGMPYDLRIKLIEADFCSNPNGMMDTDTIRGGVEFDADGAPVAYHFQKTHPGDVTLTPKWEWVRVPAFGVNSGRRNVLHLFDRERPGQKRGIALLAPVINTLKQLTRYSEAELMAAVVSSFFTVFVKNQAAANDILGESLVPNEKVTTPSTDPSNPDNNLYEMGHGSIISLADNESIEMADPKRPNGNFDPFFVSMLRQIGSAIEIPFELMILHFTASYSASRAALLEAWKFFIARRIWLERYFCRPPYEEWLTEAIYKGRIVAPGFFADPLVHAAWCGSKWMGPGQGQLDPVRETQAALLKIKGNLSTHVKETAGIDGDDWDTMISSRAREETILEEKGLPSISGGMTVPDIGEDAGGAGTGAPGDSGTQPASPAQDQNNQDNGTPNQDGNNG